MEYFWLFVWGNGVFCLLVNKGSCLFDLFWKRRREFWIKVLLIWCLTLLYLTSKIIKWATVQNRPKVHCTRVSSGWPSPWTPCTHRPPWVLFWNFPLDMQPKSEWTMQVHGCFFNSCLFWRLGSENGTRRRSDIWFRKIYLVLLLFLLIFSFKSN